MNITDIIQYGKNTVLDIKPSGPRSYTKQRPTVKVYKRGSSEIGCGGLLRQGTPATRPTGLNFDRYEYSHSQALICSMPCLFSAFRPLALWHLVASTLCWPVALELCLKICCDSTLWFCLPFYGADLSVVRLFRTSSCSFAHKLSGYMLLWMGAWIDALCDI